MSTAANSPTRVAKASNKSISKADETLNNEEVKMTLPPARFSYAKNLSKLSEKKRGFLLPPSVAFV